MIPMKRCMLFIACFIVLGCGPAINHTNQCGSQTLPSEQEPFAAQNEFGDPLYWDVDAFPIRVVIDERMDGRRANVVMHAIAEWNGAAGLQVFTAERGPRSYYGLRNTIFIEEGRIPDGPCGETILGLATRYYSTNMFGTLERIDHATIILSDLVPSEQATNTAIHELGHALCFSHSRNIEDVMYPYNDPTRGGITQQEIEYIIQMATRTEDMLRIEQSDNINPLMPVRYY